ncbi:hypothetical protein ERN12_08860 [Rhodobacteraceae bacterium]|nr:hypothetical protein ERN12_08860 [Paracoccaceae bacterium]
MDVMGPHHEHDLHRRRFSRNLGLGLVLAALCLLVFALSVVKISEAVSQHEGARLPRSEGATRPEASVAQL